MASRHFTEELDSGGGAGAGGGELGIVVSGGGSRALKIAK